MFGGTIGSGSEVTMNRKDLLVVTTLIIFIGLLAWGGFSIHRALIRGYMSDVVELSRHQEEVVKKLIDRVEQLEIDNRKLKEKNQELEQLVEPLKKPMVSTITSYCPCPICCGPKATGRTFTGHLAEENHTVAVDPRVIPLGSTVFIEGIGWRVAQDIGGAVDGKHVDVFYKTHRVAVNRGIQRGVKVYVWPVAQ